MRKHLYLSCFTLITLSLTACESKQTGERGELIFAYSTTQDVNNFNKPMAVGASLEMRINVVGQEDKPEVKNARTRKNGPIQVVDTGINLVGLKAVKPGHTKLMVRAEDEQGNVHRDLVSMRVAEIASIQVGHSCTNKPNALYMAGTRNLDLPYTKLSAKKEPLIGYGVYPMSIKPAKAASIRRNSLDESSVVLDFAPGKQTFTLQSRLMKRPLTFQTITNSDIDTLKMDPFDHGVRTTIKQDRYVEFFPFHKGQRPCNANLTIAAKSLTPDICLATADLDDEDTTSISNKEGFIRVRGLKFGVCKYKVWFPEANESAAGTFSMEVGMFPSDSNANTTNKRATAPSSTPSVQEIQSEDPLALNVPRLYAEKNTHPLDPKNKPWWFTPLLAMLAPLLLGPLWWFKRNNRNG